MNYSLILSVFLTFSPPETSKASAQKSVIYVTTDGLRWQELFSGADASLIEEKEEELRKELLRDTPEQRREALMPFFWSVIAKQGQVFGNRDKNCTAQITNGKKFSYPGYNEMLVGYPDPRIDSNAKKMNANVTVLEWLNQKPGFQNKVAAFGTWDALPYIVNRDRSGVFIQANQEPIPGEKLSEREMTFNEIQSATNSPWDGNAPDGFTFFAAMNHLKKHHPRVVYIMFGETDAWAHEKDYKRVLRAAQHLDRNLKLLWENLQSMPEYRGKVTLIVSTDHGRGSGKEWPNHGEKVEGAEFIWVAGLGPSIPALGERADCETVTQSQIAATLASMVDEDYAGSESKAAKPIRWEPNK